MVSGPGTAPLIIDDIAVARFFSIDLRKGDHSLVPGGTTLSFGAAVGTPVPEQRAFQHAGS